MATSGRSSRDSLHVNPFEDLPSSGPAGSIPFVDMTTQHAAAGPPSTPAVATTEAAHGDHHEQAPSSQRRYGLPTPASSPQKQTKAEPIISNDGTAKTFATQDDQVFASIDLSSSRSPALVAQSRRPDQFRRPPTAAGSSAQGERPPFQTPQHQRYLPPSVEAAAQEAEESPQKGALFFMAPSELVWLPISRRHIHDQIQPLHRPMVLAFMRIFMVKMVVLLLHFTAVVTTMVMVSKDDLPRQGWMYALAFITLCLAPLADYFLWYRQIFEGCQTNSSVQLLTALITFALHLAFLFCLGVGLPQPSISGLLVGEKLFRSEKAYRWPAFLHITTGIFALVLFLYSVYYFAKLVARAHVRHMASDLKTDWHFIGGFRGWTRGLLRGWHTLPTSKQNANPLTGRPITEHASPYIRDYRNGEFL